jgi:hypothetical protein
LLFGQLAETVYVKALALIVKQDVAGVTRLIRWLRDAGGGRYEEFFRAFWRCLYDVMTIRNGFAPDGWTDQGAAALAGVAAEMSPTEILTFMSRMSAEEESLRTSREPDLVLATALLLCIDDRRRLLGEAPHAAK